MAARTRSVTALLTTFRPSLTHVHLRVRGIRSRSLHTSSIRGYPVVTSQATTTAQQNSASTSIPISTDNRNSAFLGEADSNDQHEVNITTNPPSQAALDARHSAYLGEADSDDGFEAHRDAHGTIESVDASQSAFLGEADSDDGFESDVEVHPEKHRHQFDEESVRGSALHGESGEGDG